MPLIYHTLKRHAIFKYFIQDFDLKFDPSRKYRNHEMIYSEPGTEASSNTARIPTGSCMCMHTTEFLLRKVCYSKLVMIVIVTDKITAIFGASDRTLIYFW